MISVTKLRSGITFKHKGDPWRIQDYKHVHLSRGAGTITVKARNLITGKVETLIFSSGGKVEEIVVDRMKFTFLYKDDGKLIFMNKSNFEQVEMEEALIGDKWRYLKDGQEVETLIWKGKVLDIEVPIKVTLEVVEANPGVKGDTVAGASKEVEVENGIKIRVPLFIKKGDRIVVDSRTGEYVERSK
jgi:elongation factor P